MGNIKKYFSLGRDNQNMELQKEPQGFFPFGMKLVSLF